MPLIWNAGVLLFTNEGQLAWSRACCCGGTVGCCQLATDVNLVAEVTSSTNSCFTVGATADLTQVAPEIWRTSETPWTPDEGWDGLEMTCADDSLVLSWFADTAGCPTLQNEMTLISGECDPFEYVFEVEINDGVGSGCNCDTGTVRFKITIDA